MLICDYQFNNDLHWLTFNIKNLFFRKVHFYKSNSLEIEIKDKRKLFKWKLHYNMKVNLSFNRFLISMFYYLNLVHHNNHPDDDDDDDDVL